MSNPSRNLTTQPQSDEAITDNTFEAIHAGTTVAEAIECEREDFDFAISADLIAKFA